jgi:hypothetical protein
MATCKTLTGLDTQGISLRNYIRSMGWEEMRNACTVLVGKPKMKRPICSCEDNIKKDRGRICAYVDWIQAV